MADSPLAAWSITSDACVLRLAGDWRRTAVGPALPLLPEAPATPGPIRFDTGALTQWDTLLPARLWQVLAAPAQAGRSIHFSGLPEDLAAMLEQAFLPQTRAAAEEASAIEEAHLGLLQGWWRHLREGWRDALLTATFLGEVLLALAAELRGRGHLRSGDLVHQLDQTGPLSLPIVGLTCFLVGLMLAYMGGAQLDRIGAQTYIADVVTVGMVREMAGLMTGVILSGRLGAAFAAQLASMQANEEIDALRALGIDPVGHLVLPRLIALVLVAPLLIAFAAFVGVLAGLPAATGVYGVPPMEYLANCLKAMTWTHLWIGLVKGTLYAALIALAGCREGLYAGRNAQAVGVATTRAVVKSLVWIVFAASATTVLFQSLGL